MNVGHQASSRTTRRANRHTQRRETPSLPEEENSIQEEQGFERPADHLHHRAERQICGLTANLCSWDQLTRILYRRQYNFEDAIDFIVGQLEGPGKLHGYRWMHAKCLERGIRIGKEDVRIFLSLLDPVNSQARQRRRLSRRV
ncbi:hypothetical protein N1851_005378 [Merluccius polli]|uniref:Uncharacterized protein n=1 Tax=Merluccius polli TaxID=89951 RepID=A0AA47N7E9_MERPO|nr:hypothetical protein N1851_005378 [Merluccius polli]